MSYDYEGFRFTTNVNVGAGDHVYAGFASHVDGEVGSAFITIATAVGAMMGLYNITVAEGDTAFLAVAGAFACFFLGTSEDLHTTFELLEWETLVFFAGLFIMIEGINEIGVIRAIGEAVSSLIVKAPVKWQSFLAHMMILWVSGLASSVLDNIAFTATMIPVIQVLGSHPELNLDVVTLAWALALGACFGGNGTLVGAGANLVTAGICATNGHPVSFGMFFQFGFSCMLISMVVSSIHP